MKTRTGYSFRTAFGHLEEVSEANPWSFAPITDRASTFGFTKWNELSKKQNKKPVFGVELAVTPSIHEKKPARSHMTFVAKKTLAPIHKLLERATSQFRYEPLLTYNDINEINTDEIAILIGRSPSVENINVRAGLFLDAAPSTPPALLRWAQGKIPIIASSDNKYPTVEDQTAYEILIGRTASLQTFPQHILSHSEWLMHMKNKEWINNAELLASECSAELQTAKLLVPEKEKTLEQMCFDGAVKLGIDLTNPVYQERLKHELEIIDAKDFEDYFYIISDLIHYSRSRMFIGPARGSSCGSLVCYLLGITTIDPIPHDLIFERFIDITRSDLPDIDIDFNDEQRQQSIDYLIEKYGKDHVARLGTVSLYRAKSAINESGAALKVPKWRVDQFVNNMIEKEIGEREHEVEDAFKNTAIGRKLLEDFPELQIATKIEGHPRHYSQHAGGIIITDKPITDYVGIDSRTGATQCDKKDAEELNLLKLDALGLTQLSVFDDCLEMIGKPREWLFNYPLDDQKAYDILNNGKFTGIFQWNGPSLQQITNKIKVSEFSDLSSITSLARPGPADSGQTKQWIDRKNENEPLLVPHELFYPILEQTLGVIIYQEQVMRVAREIGGLSWPDVTGLRKAMSKSKGREYIDREYRGKFIPGAIENGLSSELADEVWDGLCKFGGYGFNKSHAVAYGLVSYWCCVLKAHYPVEFAAATLSHEKDPEKQLKTLREIAAEGVEYVAVDAKESTDKWTVGTDGRLLGPLTQVNGLGPKLLHEILHTRAHGLPLPKRAVKLLSKPTTKIDDLYPIQSKVRELIPDLQEFGIVSPITPLEKIQITGKEEEFVVICRLAEINLRNHNEPSSIAKRGYKMNGQTEYLSLIIEDDTDRIFGNIWRYDFERCGKQILETGQPGKAIWLLKGKTSHDFRSITIKKVKFVGLM